MNELLYSELVKAALREDIRSGDITTSALMPPEATARASMNFREEGVVCGLNVATLVFSELASLWGDEPEISIEAEEGAHIEAGMTVFSIEGEARLILTGERVALNFVQRLSGIATLTSRFVNAVEGTNARIADTRKTTPGLRLLEKYAVRCGGGTNHRFALDDLVLIKDNHIALCGGIREALQRAREGIGHTVKIEIECDTMDQVQEAVDEGADIILLDNMPPTLLRKAVQIINRRAITEASGGVNLDTVRAIAESGVDVISVGQLTHGARALDIGLDIELD